MALRDFLRRTLTLSVERPDVVKTVSHPLNAFGKLPIYKDFISCGLTDNASREFRDFVSDGFSRRWCSRDGWHEVPIPPHSFLLALPGSERCVAGTLWGSSDQGSLRTFPFTLFSVVSGDAADPVSALDYVDAFERHATSLRQSGAEQTLQSFYERYRGARIELGVRSHPRVRAAVEPVLARLTIADFARQLLGEGRQAAWPGLVSSLLSAARADGAAAVRLPLATSLSVPVQLTFWLLLLEHRSAPQATGLLYAWDTPRPRAVVFFRRLHPDDFLLLHPSATDYERVEELTVADAPEAGKPLEGSLASLLR